MPTYRHLKDERVVAVRNQAYRQARMISKASIRTARRISYEDGALAAYALRLYALSDADGLRQMLDFCLHEEASETLIMFVTELWASLPKSNLVQQ